MRIARMNVLALLAVTLVTCAAAVPLFAQSRTPLDAYKTYLDAASKATTPDALFPFISKEYKSLLQKAPKAEVDKMIKMGIAKEKLADIAVKSQQVTASKAVLELTAKTGDGRPATGKVTMVKEGGTWKLDEDAWATPPKK
jgi:hypothetical protein